MKQFYVQSVDPWKSRTADSCLDLWDWLWSLWLLGSSSGHWEAPWGTGRSLGLPEVCTGRWEGSTGCWKLLPSLGVIIPLDTCRFVQILTPIDVFSHYSVTITCHKHQCEGIGEIPSAYQVLLL